MAGTGPTDRHDGHAHRAKGGEHRREVACRTHRDEGEASATAVAARRTCALSQANKAPTKGRRCSQVGHPCPLPPTSGDGAAASGQPHTALPRRPLPTTVVGGAIAGGIGELGRQLGRGRGARMPIGSRSE